MENEILREERERLAAVLEYIDQTLLSETPNEANMREYITEERRRIWDDYSHRPDDTELMQANQTLEADTERYFRMRDKIYQLRTTRLSPYFARIDFRPDGETDAEPIYIGNLSLMDHRTYEVLICDWRADIASLYYDSALGKCSYRSRDGITAGEITLRRQMKIENTELKYAFDTDLNISDTVLMEELGKNSDAKLKTIVTTIQKEQNEVIRNADSDLLLVRGSAGSGKTSVAIHRLAYLLYHNRGVLSADQIVIFSPSEVFSSYIADLLPELGENDVIRTDFYHYFSGGTQTRRCCDRGEQLEALLTSGSDELRTMIRVKGSADFAEKLEQYAEKRYASAIVPENLTFGGHEISTGEELSGWFFDDYRAYPPSIRLGKILTRLEDSAEDFREEILKKTLDELTLNGIVSLDPEERRSEGERIWDSMLREMKDRVSGMLMVSPETLYLDFLEAEYPAFAAHTRELFAQDVVAYEDLFPLSWIRVLTGEIPANRAVRHIVADEAQDAPMIAYLLLNRIFPQASFTVLWDPSQQIDGEPFSETAVANAFPEKKKKRFCHLGKSYRSTHEICAFAQRFREHPGDLRVVDRHGAEPQIIPTKNRAEQICEILKNYRANGHTTNMILCRTAEECGRLYEELIGKTDVIYLHSYDTFRPGTTVILPAYLSKGLEADGVIVADVSEEWKTEEDRSLLYVASTRALHELTLLTRPGCPWLD